MAHATTTNSRMNSRPECVGTSWPRRRNALRRVGTSRDAFGNPTQLRRSDSANPTGGSLSLNRSHSHSYNRRRLLTGETASTEGTTWSLGYGYHANGYLSSQSYPSGLSVSYAPNALGQASQVGSYATAVLYHPDGSLKSFSYGNGLLHSRSQNTRQLPERLTDCTTSGNCAPANARLDLSYQYDANGNPSQISDAIDGRQTRGMSYDGLDRLTGTTSTAFGTASYSYDRLDNLTRVQIGGPQSRDQGYCYSNNQLTTIKTGTCSGSTLLSLSYDVQGNLSSKGSQGYSFDYGNRLRTATGLESYRYDAHGRRIYSQSSAGILRTQYSQSGSLLYAENSRSAKRTEYVYLQGRLIAQRERPTSSSTVTTRYLHTDGLGSPLAITNTSKAFVEKSEFEPYGQVINRPLRDGPGYTAHLEDAATGLNYLQQRYYDPQLGLFLSVDPITAYSSPLSQFHRYRYANNNPYRHIDLDGRASSDCTGTRIPSVCDSGMIAGLTTYGGDERKKNSQETPANEAARGAANAPVNNNGESDTTSDVMYGGSPTGLITLFPLNRGLTLVKWAVRILGVGRIATRAETKGAALQATDKQIGRKFGEHRDPSRPGYRTHDEYRQRAEEVFKDPSAKITRFPQGSPAFPGETHFQVGDDLLRLDPAGNFRSLYPVN